MMTKVIVLDVERVPGRETEARLQSGPSPITDDAAELTAHSAAAQLD